MENSESSSIAILNSDIACVLPSNLYGSIQGITTLNDCLYLVKHGSKQIDVFNASDYSSLDPILVDIDYPSGLASCSKHGCLYIADERFNEDTYEGVFYIVKVTLSTHSIDKWNVPGLPRGISIMKNCNVLISIWDLRPNETDKLLEYTTNGELTRVISLDKSLDCIYDALELSTDIYAVCHNGIQQHRVCTVDSNGTILRSFGGIPGSKVGELNLPLNLTSDRYGNVFVADRANNRVQMLSSTLDYMGDVKIAKIQLNTPRRIHFDQLTLRLYISHRN